MQEKHASGTVFPLMPQGLVHGWSLFPGHLCFPPLLKKKIVSTENREKSISVWARTQNFTWRKMIHPVFQGNGKSRRGSRCAEKLLGRHRRGAHHSQRGPPTQDIFSRGLKMTKSVSLTSRLHSTEERLTCPDCSVKRPQLCSSRQHDLVRPSNLPKTLFA